MKALRLTALAMAAATVCAACASISFYQNEDFSGHEVGLRVYTLRPYVMVSRTRAKDAPLRIEVVSLPDLANPRYVRIRPGIIGNSKLSMSFANGGVASIGVESDSGVSGLISAYGSLLTSQATAEKLGEEAANLRQQRLQNLTASDVENVSRETTQLIGLIRDDIVSVLASPGGRTNLLPRERHALEAARDALAAEVATPRGAPATRLALQGVIANWRRDVRASSAVSNERQKPTFETLQAVFDALSALASSLAPETPQPDFTLYEIDTVNGHTVYREVDNATLTAIAALRLRLQPASEADAAQ